jgi:pyruvate formate lyase activating enzyme
MQGIVFDIKRFAVHDGPGIRTTVHFKGCPLQCLWCHNPEGIDPAPLTYTREVRVADRLFLREETIGTYYTVEKLLKELLKDRMFWDESDGGVTFSGGEPLMQFPFVLELAQQLKKQSIHVAIDTCGLIQTEKLQAIAPFVDLFLFDLKAIESGEHKAFTGSDNQLILKNLGELIENGHKVNIRIPVVPGRNFDDKHFIEFLQFLNGKKVEQISLLPFHAIASGKYERFSMHNSMKNVPSIPKEALHDWKNQLELAGFAVAIGS